MNVRENIFRLMEERGMTQKEFSERSGIAESTVSDWKRKQLNPGVDKLPMICRTLGVTSDALLGIDAAASDYVISDDVGIMIEAYKKLDPDMKRRLIAYMEGLYLESEDHLHSESTKELRGGPAKEKTADTTVPLASDKDFQIRKVLARRLRKLSRLSRLVIDESEHASGLNLHLYRYLDFLGLDRLDFIKDYLSHIQPYMIREIKSQEKFDNAVCVLDEYYRISVYIKADTTRGEEIVVSFHENNKGGIARNNRLYRRDDAVYVFADSIGSHVKNTDNYSVNLFIMRGVRTFPLNISAVKYDEDGFLVRYSDINNALIGISNRYLEDLYTLDIDISDIELFTSLQQISFTSFGNDVFSNISLLIDSLIVQKDAISRQIADAALCIYCSNVKLMEKDRKELVDTLKMRFAVNSVKALPQILERVELNLKASAE